MPLLLDKSVKRCKFVPVFTTNLLATTMTSTEAAAVLADLVRTFGILDTTELLAQAATHVAAESEEEDADLLHFAAAALTSTAANINKA